MKTILFKVLKNRKTRVYVFIVSKSDVKSVVCNMSKYYDFDLQRGEITDWKYDIVDSLSLLTK